MSYQIITGDCLDAMKAMPDGCIDSVVTDPPYGLGKEPDPAEVIQSWIEQGEYKAQGRGFMNAQWDAFVPSPIVWQEVLRVLKPGGHILCFAGTRTQDWMTMSLRFGGFQIRDVLMFLYGTGFPKSCDIAKSLNQANEPEMNNISKQWQGWKTQLKPAYEPIILARKPPEGSNAENILKYGVGGLNIDGCRIGDDEIIIKGYTTNESNQETHIFGFVHKNKSEYPVNRSIGRYPANVIHDGSDEVIQLFPTSNVTKNGNSGSVSRFFYTAKASKQDRDEGLEEFELQKYSHDGRNKSIENPYQRNNSMAKNNHPTVKPTELMRYLCRLITPPQGIILDPFCGSGSTGKAAILEGFNFIGIEIDPHYAKIASARCEYAKNQNTVQDNNVKTQQLKLFKL